MCTPFLLFSLFTPLCGLPSNKALLCISCLPKAPPPQFTPMFISVTFFLSCCSCLDFGLLLGIFTFLLMFKTCPTISLCCLFIYIPVYIALNFLLILLFIILSILIFPSVLLRTSSQLHAFKWSYSSF